MVSPQSQSSGLTTRQHEREGITLPVEFIVSPAHGAQVRFSTSSTAMGPHAFRGEAIDISSGGMGLKCRQYLPRMCEGTVKVYTPTVNAQDGNSAAPQSPAASDVLLEQRVKVRRVTLIGREPVYSLGVAFLEHGPAVDEQVAAILERINRQADGASYSIAGGARA